MLAKQLGISRTIVHRVWQRHVVQPHRVERFKLSNDPCFPEEKVAGYCRAVFGTRPTALWCCVWTRRARFRRWIARRRFFHCGPACRSVKPTTTNATAPPLCSPPSTSSMARSSAPASSATVVGSS